MPASLFEWVEAMKQGTFAILVTWTAATSVWGHPGPRIWVDVDGGTVSTNYGPYPPAMPQDYYPSTVFTQPMSDEGDGIWYTDFPGYQMVPGGTIPNGTDFSYNITGPLLWYNPGDAAHCPYFETAYEHFEATPPVPQMAIYNEQFLVRYTSTGFVTGDWAFSYNGNPGDHNHLTYVLLGDGINAGGGLDGIYALPLQLVAEDFGDSETYYILLGKNVSEDELAEAADVIAAPRIAPDLDCDGDVDVDDYELFEVCDAGPEVLPPSGAGLEYCVVADFDEDGDVDLTDFRWVQSCFRGTDVASDAMCLP